MQTFEKVCTGLPPDALQAFDFELRRKYTQHYLCKQVLDLMIPCDTIINLFDLNNWFCSDPSSEGY
jgi:hypothetical protein